MQSKPVEGGSGFMLGLNDYTDWEVLSIDEVFARLESAPDGLPQHDAAARFARYGANELRAEPPPVIWFLLLRQFRSVLILILMIGALISICSGEVAESIAILLIILFSAGLGFAQEYQAERALRKLRDLVAPTAIVVRDAAEQRIPAREIVPGDILVVRAGDKIAADARLFECVNLRVDEAALTGESTPAEKTAQALAEPRLPIAEQYNMLFAGTTALYGRGRALVTATGPAMEFGQVAELLAQVESPTTPLQRSLDRLGVWLARVIIAIVLVVVTIEMWRGAAWADMVLFGIALAVAAIPEALPAVVTAALALGVQRMARRHALVRNLSAVETLGCVSVICADKTGTLTRDEMTVRYMYVGDQILEVTGGGYALDGDFRLAGRPVSVPAPACALLRGAVLCCDAVLLAPSDGAGWRIWGDPTEGAILVAAAKAHIERAALARRMPRIAELPFTPEAKRMVTLHATTDGVIAYLKGAPEVLAPQCSRWLTAAGEVELSAHQRRHILEVAQRFAAQALRVLAVASKRCANVREADYDLTFLGLIGMSDPLRSEAKAAIELSVAAGIKAVMITGDHRITAEAIARELGFSGEIVTGADLDAMTQAQLVAQAGDIQVYARVSPRHKLRVVQALQSRGEVVAMTGDGINDAPALKQANVGVAMGASGVDISKEAAAVTLTDDNFATIMGAVAEGRVIYANIKKCLMYLLASNTGEIGLVGLAALAGWPLPLTPVQILYINLATDGLPALALAADPGHPEMMRQPPRDPRGTMFSRSAIEMILIGGVWSTVVNLSFFAYLLHHGASDARARGAVFVSLLLLEFFKVFIFRTEMMPVWSQPFANRWLNRSVLIELGLLVLLLVIPQLQGVFGVAELSSGDMLSAILVAASILPALEGFKWLTRHRAALA